VYPHIALPHVLFFLQVFIAILQILGFGLGHFYNLSSQNLPVTVVSGNLQRIVMCCVVMVVFVVVMAAESSSRERKRYETNILQAISPLHFLHFCLLSMAKMKQASTRPHTHARTHTHAHTTHTHTLPPLNLCSTVYMFYPVAVGSGISECCSPTSRPAR
jgi:uncharacterized membrane protein